MPQLMIGFGTSDITPPIGTELCGFGPYLERKATGIIEPLLAKAMLWQCGEARGAIISCDLVGISREIAHEVRTMLLGECGLPYDGVVVCATHTHSGPSTYDNIGWGRKNPEYLKDLPGMIAKSVKPAMAAMRPARLEYGETPVSGIAYNREYKGGITDDRLKVLKVISAGNVGGDAGGSGCDSGCGGKLMGFLANYSCHPVVMCEQTSLISGDFVGLAANKAGADNQCTGIFLQGSIGDQNPIYCHLPQDVSIRNLDALSGTLAGFIQQALDSARPIPCETAGVRRKEISLPKDPAIINKPGVWRAMKMIEDFMKHEGAMPEELRRRLKFEKDSNEKLWDTLEDVEGGTDPVARDTEIQAVRFGDFVIVTHPAELFLCFQKRVEESLEPLKTMVAGYAGDYVGYIAPPDKYVVRRDHYSYAVYEVSHISGELPFKENAGDVLAKEMIGLARCIE